MAGEGDNDAKGRTRHCPATRAEDAVRRRHRERSRGTAPPSSRAQSRDPHASRAPARIFPSWPPSTSSAADSPAARPPGSSPSAGTTSCCTRCAPSAATPAHKTDRLAELVCSNTFKSTETVQRARPAQGRDARCSARMILECADEARVPGGSALTVDRDVFSRGRARARSTAHPRITVERERGDRRCRRRASSPPVRSRPTRSPRPSARGSASSRSPSTTPSRRSSSHDSIDHDVVFRASRYGKETMEGAGDEGAYLNCPMSREQYEAFLDALIAADQYDGARVRRRAVLRGLHARRGDGAARPRDAALRADEAGRPRDPRTGREAYAVVQLRMEDRGGPHVEPRRLPDAAPLSRAAARLPHDPRARERGVPALRLDPPQLVPQRAGRALAAPRAARRSARCCSPASSPASRATPRARRPGCSPASTSSRMLAGEEPVHPAADDDARRAVPLPARGRPAALPADERELRPGRRAADAR